MKNGNCPRCQGGHVRRKANGVTTGSKKVHVTGLSLLNPSVDRVTYLCTDCGYMETYIEDPTILEKVRDRWETV